MNPRAAQELLDLIMLDEFVARRKALDDWSRRWVATMHTEFIPGPGASMRDPAVAQVARQTLLTNILDGLVQDQVHVLNWGATDRQQELAGLPDARHHAGAS